MDLDGARVFVAGATGVLGQALTDALLAAGARVVPGGRDQARLAEVAARCGTEGVRFDAVDVASCESATRQAAEQLDGFDLLVVTVGAPGFGPALDTGAALSEELFAVNVLGPMSLVRAAAPHLASGGTVCVFSAVHQSRSCLVSLDRNTSSIAWAVIRPPTTASTASASGA